MTVRLVRAYGGYAAGATYDGTADEEVDLVAKGNAVWDTRGATAGGGPGNAVGGFSASYVITADGSTDHVVKQPGASRCAVSAVGTVNYAVIYVEDADTGDIWGAFGAPMSGARWCAVPVGQFNLRARIEGLSGTSMTVTLAGGV